MVMPQWNWSLWTNSSGGYTYTNNYTFCPAPTLVPTPGYVSESMGGTVTVQVGGIYPGLVLTFLYGGSNGFGYNAPGSSATVEVWSNPGFIPVPGSPLPNPPNAVYGPGVPPPTPYIGGLVREPAPMAVASMRPTKTITRTFTITQTFTASPTASPVPSNTPLPTKTPAIGPERHELYCYPNPYDRRIRADLTFRFDEPRPSGMVIYNMLGTPVAHVPLSSFFLQSFLTPIPGFGGGLGAPGGQAAQWNGRDDYGEAVAGGLYFVVLKGSNGTQVLKFTILH